MADPKNIPVSPAVPATDSTPSELRPGAVIDDFELLVKLGEGTRSSVFLARQQSMQRIVAVKIFAHHTDSSQVPQLEHPHIIRVYDQRTLPDQQLRLLYMQYQPGGTLQGLWERLRVEPRDQWTGQRLLELLDQSLAEQEVEIASDSIQRDRLAQMSWPETVCLLGSQMAQALSHAHAHGVRHGNLRPSKVLLNENAVPKLTGFETASAGRQPPDPDRCRFMAPEQLQAVVTGDHALVDGRSDIFSLGAILWELAAGSSPYNQPLSATGERTAAIQSMRAMRVAGIPAERAHEFPRDAPQGLRALLLKAMAGDRAERFVSAGPMAQQLSVCLDPRAAKLLLLPARGLGRFACKFPLLVIMLTLLLPNVLAGAFNYAYNYESIITPLQADQAFQRVMAVINLVAYPAATVIGIMLVWRVTREVRRRNQEGASVQAGESLRLACLRVPHRLAILGVSTWCVAGVAYPLAMRAAGTQLGGVEAFHFFGSLLLCGLIGATYPYFGATWIVTGAWYPMLFRPEIPPLSDVRQLRVLERLAPVYLILAGAVPLLGISILFFMGRSDQNWILALLSLGGLVLLLLMNFLWGHMARNLKTLISWAQRQ